jgi:hypothetical protein
MRKVISAPVGQNIEESKMILLTLWRTNLMSHKNRIYKFGNLVLGYLNTPSSIDFFAVVAFACMVGVVSFVSGVLYGFAFTGW